MIGPEKPVREVYVSCVNPTGSFGFNFDSYEDAKGDIEERLRWGELKKITYYYVDGTEEDLNFLPYDW